MLHSLDASPVYRFPSLAQEVKEEVMTVIFCALCKHPGAHATDGGTKTTCEHCPACAAERRRAAEQDE